RMVYEITGAACVGYAVTFRIVTRATDNDGNSRISDLQTTTYEAGDGSEFEFLNRSFVGQKLNEESRGRATRQDGSLHVTLSALEEKSLSFPGELLFPTQHAARLTAGGKAGERFVQAASYDGSDGGEKIFNTTAVIG